MEQGLLKLLAIKDSDIRQMILEQGRKAVDQSVHFGGAFSQVIPLVGLFYGGFFEGTPERPLEGDVFVLSKGHGIAAMAAVYTDKGYFSPQVFEKARSYESILNSHPGPILPGVHLATGPLGQGGSVAVGFAQAQMLEESGRTYCLMGDGEIQEGIPWEAFLYGGAKRLHNFCLIVDCNGGSNDDVHKLSLPMEHLSEKLEAFGFAVAECDGTGYRDIIQALDRFSRGEWGKPLAILSRCKKGEGSFGELFESHKTNIDECSYKQETALQAHRRGCREQLFCQHYNTLPEERQRALAARARDMGLLVVMEGEAAVRVEEMEAGTRTKRVEKRDKSLRYNTGKLPDPKPGEQWPSDVIVSAAVAAFGEDPRMVTIDADMGNITGLQTGMNRTNTRQALNTGIAESHMMGMAEAFAARGYNAWCGSFGMFLDWRVMRRIAVSQQERMECIGREDGWLNGGHTLDIAFLATASNLDAQTNGATHMSIDDANVFLQTPHVRVVDTACPRLLLSVMRWIAGGGRGLVVLRTTRAPTEVLYSQDFEFSYGKGYPHGDLERADAVIVSSGRGIYEAITAAELLDARGIPAAAVDMPSFDGDLLLSLAGQNKLLVFAEQNNGFLLTEFLAAACRQGVSLGMDKVLAINTLGPGGEKRLFHSGTYSELLKVTGLEPGRIAHWTQERLELMR